MPVATRFGDEYKRRNHYVDHGSDFGATDAVDYEMQAAGFLNAPLSIGGDIEEGTRSSGDIVRYNKITNEFAIMHSDGTICTYFKPMMRSTAPPGYPRKKTHRRASNYQYFLDECAR